jgi:uncharacterized protein YegJ (DUF2314 family)
MYITIVFVELDEWNIVGVLPNFGDLVFKVEVGELSDVASFEIIDWFSVGERQED